VKATDLTDFPDRFSPMLVKELRQGMRARAFTGVFLGLQLLLGLLLLGAVLASDSERTGGVVSTMVFTFFVLAVVVIQPLRGMGALAGEMREHTIDLMVLTRLTSWRIVLGKWVAIVSQSLLLSVTFIPYLILRYFFGGMNLLGELFFLLCLLGLSVALTALTVGLSACRLAVVRVLVPLGVGFFVLIAFAVMLESVAGPGGGFFAMFTATSRESLVGLMLYFMVLAYLSHQWMSMGATLIASAAENHATGRRLLTLLALAALGVSLLFVSWRHVETWWTVCVALVCLPALVIALSESGTVAPSVLKITRRRWRALAWLLVPGKSSGYLFSVAVALLVAVFSPWMGVETGDDEFFWLAGIWGAALFPAVVLRYTHRSGEQRIGAYLLVFAASVALSLVVHALASATNNDGLLLLFVWCPAVFAIGDVDGFKDSGSGVALVMLVLLLYNLILGIPAVRGAMARRKSEPGTMS
jgi:hypothetical protein